LANTPHESCLPDFPPGGKFGPRALGVIGRGNVFHMVELAHVIVKVKKGFYPFTLHGGQEPSPLLIHIQTTVEKWIVNHPQLEESEIDSVKT